MRYFFFVVCIFAIKLLHSQDEFAPIGATWYYDQIQESWPLKVGYVKIASVKDTVINNVSAKKLELITFYTDSSESTPIYDYIHQSGDSVFYYRNEKFELMYCFNLSVDDSLKFYGSGYNPCNPNSNYGNTIVDSTFEISIGSTSITGLYFSELDSSSWINSKIAPLIGNFNGFYPSYVNSCQIMDDFPAIGTLRCYSDSEHGLFEYKNIPCDTLINNSITKTNDIEINKCVIYPTISHGFITLEFSYHGAKKVEIYNSYAKKVLEKRTKGNNLNMNLTSMNSGIYFVFVYNNNTVINKKKIIIE